MDDTSSTHRFCGTSAFSYRHLSGKSVIDKRILLIVSLTIVTLLCFGGAFYLIHSNLENTQSSSLKIVNASETPVSNVSSVRIATSIKPIETATVTTVKYAEATTQNPRPDEGVTSTTAPNTPSRIPIGEDADPIARERRNKVREMALHVWQNYKLYAWGKNELRPLSKEANKDGFFRGMDLGTTIVDGLDTLYIMGLNEQYEEGRDWIARRFTLKNLSGEIPVFDTNIKFVGGFLSMYALTGDQMYKEKAQEVADILLPAFNTSTGVPNSLVDIQTGESKVFHWNHGNSILAELGALHLEFSYLSEITGNPVYRERVMKVREKLNAMEKPNGLYPNFLNPNTGQWGKQQFSIGALGDGFYEYLLKSWIQSGKTDKEALQMYDDAMKAVVENLIQLSKGKLIYPASIEFGQLQRKMDHVACISGGLFALRATTQPDSNSERYMEIGKGITNTCHESYIRSATHLGPDAFRFTNDTDVEAVPGSEQYVLRPETFESYFTLWRLTKDQRYREWGWDAIQSIEKYCKSPSGYSGIENVDSDDPQKDNFQATYFIAETLKYLYLLYSDDSLIPLDDWVFNAEAHLIPVKH